MRKTNLLGQRFGRYVVTAEAPTRTMPGGQRVTYWKCACDCGSEREVSSQNLREGKSQSCGCRAADAARARAHDLAGQRFGRLVAVARGETLADESTTWVCRCDCGKEKVVRTMLLIHRGQLSCGCLRDFMSAYRRWRGDDVSYLAMHDRIRGARGHAKEHLCVDCGERALDWSYDGGDPNEKYEVIKGSRLSYSTDVDRYSPRCRGCHRRHDVAARRVKAGVA